MGTRTPKNKILNSDYYYNTPFYIRPLGLKPCKHKPVNKYHAYDMVIDTGDSIEITHVKVFHTIFFLPTKKTKTYKLHV